MDVLNEMNETNTKNIKSGVCAAKGFVSAGICSGIKSNSKKDLAMIYCENKCTAAALFTTNKVKAAPIMVTEKNLRNKTAQAVIVNSGNANACVSNGTEIANTMCDITASSLGINSNDIIVASTGVIGQPLTVEPFENGIPILTKNLSEFGNDNAAKAIMTTDTFEKTVSLSTKLDSGETITIGGIAKGSGMINPNMATMLCFLTTDIKISGEMLDIALRNANEDSFNMISVDGDTSTNDMVCIMASGLAGNSEIKDKNSDYEKFYFLLKEVMETLSKKMARDGEGATKLIACEVSGAESKTVARAIAKSVVSSSLVKAAMGAADANWGRVLCAIGYAPCEFDVGDVNVSFSSDNGEVVVCDNGVGVPFSEKKATKILSEEEIGININLKKGKCTATAWGCDLTEEYVKINADYRS